MKYFWLAAIAAFLLQESATVSAVLLEGCRSHHNLWAIHFCFLAATLLDLVVGYSCGKYLQGRPSRNWVLRKALLMVPTLENLIGSVGSKFALVLLGPLAPTWANAALGSFLRLGRAEVFSFVLLGELLWYAMLWPLVLGIHTWVKNAYVAFSALVVLSLLISVLLQRIVRANKSFAPEISE